MHCCWRGEEGGRGRKQGRRPNLPRISPPAPAADADVPDAAAPNVSRNKNFSTYRNGFKSGLFSACKLFCIHCSLLFSSFLDIEKVLHLLFLSTREGKPLLLE